MKLIPYPGKVIVKRINKDSDSSGGVWVPRQDQEETPFARVVHGGDSGWDFLQLLLVRPHCGTDFEWAEDEQEFTILDVENDEVFGEVEEDE